MTNILVSSDEERKINEILDSGINEFKSTNNNVMLKSSILNNENSSIDGYSSPSQRESNFHISNCNLLKDPLYSNNHKNNFNSGSLNSNKVHSSALRQLLNEMKVNSKFESSSDDEIDMKFRPKQIDLMQTNTLTSDRVSAHHTEINVKDDIKILQNKINGLEKKLFSDVNPINYYSTNNSLGLPSDKKNIIKTTKKTHSDDEIINNFKINKSNYMNCSKSKDQDSSYFSSSMIMKEKNKSSSLGRGREVLKKDKKIDLRSSHNRSNSNVLDDSVKTNNILKNKFEKLTEKFDIQKTNLIKERQVNLQLTKKLKKIQKKENSYDDLYNSYMSVTKKYKDTLIKLDESDLIRKEQAKLIKSLQREIDILRGNYEVVTPGNNLEKVIDNYKDLKNNFYKNEENYESDGENVQSYKINKPIVKKKCKSKSKPKLKIKTSSYKMPNNILKINQK